MTEKFMKGVTGVHSTYGWEELVKGYKHLSPSQDCAVGSKGNAFPINSHCYL
jgi:hypothetical protein